MHLDLLLNNILSIPILFFFLGFIAVQLKSDLEIPQPTSRFLSIYLLMCIGLKGGHELAHGNWNDDTIQCLSIALLMSAVVPLYVYPLIRRKFNSYNAAAIAATYGSISVVTFISAVAFLQEMGISYGGYMVAAMAMMESPALIVSLILLQRALPKDHKAPRQRLISLLGESMTNSSVFMILGGLLIGCITPEQSFQELKPFTDGLFKGFLSVFLLDMGLVASRRIKALTRAGTFLISMAIFVPIVNALISIGLAFLLGVSAGNALLLAVLCSSASYIAVPAALRMTIPQANPGLFVPMALTVTFPFNVTLGIPLYYYIITLIWK
jgi:hypothetical protein